MNILQIAIENINALDWGHALSAAGGGLITAIGNKLLSWRHDKAKLHEIQSEVYNKVMASTNAVLEKALKQACFRDPCKRRINAENESE